MRARKGEADSAVAQYIDAEFFFSQQGGDTILEPDPQEPLYNATCLYANHGYGKKGQPIYLERTGKINTWNLFKVLHLKDTLRRHYRQQIFCIERMKQKSHELGTLVESQICILDMAGLSMRYHGEALRSFRGLIRMDERYFPERLCHMVLINTPWLFQGFWGLMKGWLDPKTKEKFMLLGSDYKDKLLEIIDADQLPVEYGGTCECGGTKTEGRSVNTGTCIPELVPLSEAAKAAAIQRRQDIIDGTVAHPWDTSGFDDGGGEEAPQAAPAVAAPEPEPEPTPTGWASMSWL